MSVSRLEVEIVRFRIVQASLEFFNVYQFFYPAVFIGAAYPLAVPVGYRIYDKAVVGRSVYSSSYVLGDSLNGFPVEKQ